MELTVHKVDPNGDTLLILRNPNAPFAGDATVWPNALPKYRTEKLRRNERELKLLAQAQQSTPNSLREVHFHLSSKHLTLTSDYFRGLMARNWKEANPSQDFAYTVTAEDWDEAALLMVMNIIHCQTSEISQNVDSEMVAKIAVIIDYYQCRKAVSFYVETWMKNFDVKEISSCGYGRKLLLRLFISHFFLNADDFHRSTQIIIRESRGPIHSLGLLPQNIIDALEDERKRQVSGIITGLHRIIEQPQEEPQEDSETCSSESSSGSIDVLVNAMKAMNLYEPRPAPPFTGYSFAAIEKGLFKTQRPKDEPASRSKRKHNLGRCEFGWRIRCLFPDRMPGLKLERFIDMSKKT
ncbi:hypothetical protein GGI43DRAFT_166914 [Trichoderma evansii]